MCRAWEYVWAWLHRCNSTKVFVCCALSIIIDCTSSDLGELTEPHIKFSYSLLASLMNLGGNLSEGCSFFSGKTKIRPHRRKFRNKKNFSPMPRISSTCKKMTVRLTHTLANNLECLLLVAEFQTLPVLVSVGHHQLLNQSKNKAKPQNE